MSNLKKLFIFVLFSFSGADASCRTKKVVFKNGTDYPIDLCFTKYFGPKKAAYVFLAKWESKELFVQDGEVKMAEPTWFKWNMGSSAKKRTQKKSYKIGQHKKFVIYDSIFSGLKIKRER